METEQIKIKKTADKKAYFQKYYKEHPEKYIARTSIVVCECCKSEVQKKNWGQHKKTLRHIKLSN